MSWTRLEKKGYRRKAAARVARTLLSANCGDFFGPWSRIAPSRTRTRVSAATQRRSAHSLAHHGSVLRPDLVHHANFSRLRVRVFVDSHIFLRQLVDVLGRAVLGNLNHGAADLHIAIRIVGIDNGQRHPRIAAHVAILLPAAR